MVFISILIFLLLISSGSIFCSSYFNKKYEEVLPITCIGIVLISFIFGIIGILKFSTVFLLILGLVLIVLGIVKAIKDKKVINLLNNTFTPGFFVLVVLILIVILGIHGKYFDASDEFSHWGDIVKVMTIIQDFGTNPASHSVFKTYPPGMSLFQYVLEEINIFVTKEAFNEWLCYLSYDIFSIALLLPVCSKMSFKKILSPIAVCIVIFLLPYSYYAASFFSVYIDAFLGFLIAGGLLTLLWDKENDIWFVIKMSAISFMLTLSKDAGLLFAIFFVVATVITYVLRNNKKIICKENIVTLIISLCSVAIPKLLWQLNININHAVAVFSNKIDITSLINVLTGKEDSYRLKVFKNYITKLVAGTKYVGATAFQLNYICYILIIILVSYLVIRYVLKKKRINEINAKVTFGYIVVSMVVYVAGLCVIYMYKFSEIEALGLASFVRYIYIVFLGDWFFILMSIIKYANEVDSIRKPVMGIVICFAFLITNLEAVTTFVTNAYAKASQELRAPYAEVVEKTLKYVDGDDQIWFIQQESYGEDGLTYNFCIRPNYVNGYPSIGQYEDEDDIEVTRPMTPKEWRENLVSGNYDYVMLYDTNGTFRGYFKENFENPDEIVEGGLYRVDKKTGMLSLCE